MNVYFERVFRGSVIQEKEGAECFSWGCGWSIPSHEPCFSAG